MALIEKTADMANYSAWVPDLPGCVSTGETLQETARRIREAIELHVAGMREDGDPIPVPSPAVALGEAQPGSIACALLVPVPGEQTPAAAQRFHQILS